MKTFGSIIKSKREAKGLYLREVAASLGIDQAIISKYERGERKPSKKQVLMFASYYELDPEELIIEWLSDKVVYDLQNEDLGYRVLKVAEEKIKYNKAK